MLLMLSLFGLSLLCEAFALLAYRSRPFIKLATGTLAATVLAVATTLLVWQDPNIWALLVLSVSLYRLVNVLRIVRSHMILERLRHTTRRTSWHLFVAQGLLLDAWILWQSHHDAAHTIWLIVSGGVLCLIMIMLLSTLRHFIRQLRQRETTHYSNKQLPSVTVAIPARNETEDLMECIRTLLASDYPKLEVLVLDDCSQLARTPEIIRSYAHDGVRFVAGDEPKDGWLAKNQAYAKLAHEASGDLVLFCGVDMRFTVTSIRRMVEYLLAHDKSMLSLLPRNSLLHGFPLIQPMRYGWELSLPRQLFRRPPVLSSVWLISRKALQHAGGFEAVARMVVPEAYFARRAAAQGAYGFLVSGSYFGLSSEKSMVEQHATAVRTRYPQLHRRPEQVWLTTVMAAMVMLLPFCLAVVATFVTHDRLLGLLGLVGCGLLLITYSLVIQMAYGYVTLFSVIGFPLAALVDIWLMNYSMWKYEFSEVIWKGRNVCLPVMQVIPHLPRLQ